MKIWSRIVGSIYILCGFCLAAGFLSLWANTSFMDNLFPLIQENIFRFGIAGMVILLIGIVWLVNWFDFSYRTRAISFDNPGGRVKVSLRAIEEFVSSRISTQIHGIKTLRVKTSLSARGLETFINLKLLAGINIPETCANIQEITKNYLQDVVGVEHVATIEVFVSNIVAQEKTESVVGEGITGQEDEENEEI